MLLPTLLPSHPGHPDFIRNYNTTNAIDNPSTMSNIPPSSRVRIHSGFTLIELLVVISIISILASMLLPAVGMIRDMAQSTKCAGLLRQWQLANISYSSDNNGMTMPMISLSTQWAPAGGLLPWYVSPFNVEYMETTLQDTTIPYNFSNKHTTNLNCPSTPPDGRSYEGVYAYGLNIAAAWGQLNWAGGAPATYGAVPIDKIPVKTDLVSFTDGNDFLINGDPDAPLTAGPKSAYNSTNNAIDDTGALWWSTIVMYRHRASANAAFWDGHTGKIKPEQYAAQVPSLKTLFLKWNEL